MPTMSSRSGHALRWIGMSTWKACQYPGKPKRSAGMAWAEPAQETRGEVLSTNSISENGKVVIFELD